MPVIESKTHPEGKGVPGDAPVFTWAIADIERVKGFVYKLSRNVPGKPDTFTEQMSLSESGLSEGRYFLRVQGIDKTNTPGRVADYEFIVGRAERLDPKEYEKYAMNETYTEEETDKPVYVRKVFPSIELLPSASTIDSSSAEFSVEVKTPKGFTFDRLTYELYAGSVRMDRGGSGGEKIRLSGLTDGDYRLVVKGIFSRKGGKTYETKPREARFGVRIPTGESPLILALKAVIDHAVRNPLIILAFFPVLAMMLFAASSGRLIFYTREITARIMSRVRVIVSAIHSS
jgi:hypothetical protein